jgi:hypothetical protein
VDELALTGLCRSGRNPTRLDIRIGGVAVEPIELANGPFEIVRRLPSESRGASLLYVDFETGEPRGRVHPWPLVWHRAELRRGAGG